MQAPRTIFSALFLVSFGFSVIFSILMQLIFTTYSTSWQEEIWWLTYDDAPSLIGSLVFVVLLIFWWSIAISVNTALDETPTRASEKISIAVSQVMCIAIGVVLWVAWDAVEIENYHRYGNMPRDENYLEYWMRHQPYNLRPTPSSTLLTVNHIYGVWELKDIPKIVPPDSRYLALWRNEQFQFLDANYQQLSTGRLRFSLWGLPGSQTDWSMSNANFFGNSGSNYYGNANEGPHSDNGFVIEIRAGEKMKDGYSDYFEARPPIKLVLRNRRFVHSSHPILLDANFPFYNESDRGKSLGSKTNIHSLYP